jgi:peroxiredoxin
MMYKFFPCQLTLHSIIPPKELHVIMGSYYSIAFERAIVYMTAKMITRIIIIAVVVGTLAIITAGLLQPASVHYGPPRTSQSDGQQVGNNVGNIAPNFTLNTLSAPGGKKVSLSDYRGQAVLLNFWRTDCASCLVEMPDLQKAYSTQQAGQKKFVVLGIEEADDPSAPQLLQRKGITYPILVDAQLRVGDLYGVNGIPASFALDRQGNIRWSTSGPVSPETLQDVLRQVS